MENNYFKDSETVWSKFMLEFASSNDAAYFPKVSRFSAL
jgi:hypothetical protein